MAATQFSKAYKGAKDYAGTAVNAGIIVVTGGVEQITTVAIYRCPCVEASQLRSGCNGTSASLGCTQTLNTKYGIAFILAPAFALFIFGIAANPILWKIITGRTKKLEKCKEDFNIVAWTLTSIIFRAFIAPVTWVCIALVDGKYLACSITPLPYLLGTERHRTCEDVDSGSYPYSDAFHKSRTFSQVIGAIAIVVLLFVGFTVYCITQCTFPLTYYHAKYYQIYRQKEQYEFEDEMEKKAQEKAEINVKKFLAARREKTLWDKISTVFQFHRDEKQLVIYSQLHELVVGKKLEIENPTDEKPLLNNVGGEENIPMEDLEAGNAVNA